MRIVVAIGGHAIGGVEGTSFAAQREAVREVVAPIARIARQHDVLVTHGSGPQVGWLAAQTERATGERPPLDAVSAETEGLLGYWIEQELENALPGRDVAALLTQTEVDPDDAAFVRPHKPVGRRLSESEAQRLRERGIEVAPSPPGWRRVVASPRPRRIVEIRTIRLLVKLGVLVVCAGGGGIPVARDEQGALHGLEAVVDKDRSAALLASELPADRLLLLTDVPHVYADWPERERPLRRLPPHAFAGLSLDAGSMGPKVEAARHFVQGSGGVACIGLASQAEAMLEGSAGTCIDAAARG